MSIETTYLNAVIETLDLIHRLLKKLLDTQMTNKLSDYLSQIETKVDERISSSFGQNLGIDLPVADLEANPLNFGKVCRIWYD